jgi:hypothetical protein
MLLLLLLGGATIAFQFRNDHCFDFVLHNCDEPWPIVGRPTGHTSRRGKARNSTLEPA